MNQSNSKTYCMEIEGVKIIARLSYEKEILYVDIRCNNNDETKIVSEPRLEAWRKDCLNDFFSYMKINPHSIKEVQGSQTPL